jgi:RNA polymerase sigma factor (TIGR02999 family)
LVYGELRILAAQKLSREAPGQTLQATALVHEAYIRLVGEGCHDWDGRGHFFAAAAEAMRRILVENARHKRTLKKGGNLKRVGLTASEPPIEDDLQSDELLALDQAIERLSQKDSVKAQVVKLRYFAGLTMEQTARSLDISPASAKRYWAYARAWLNREMGRLQ